MEIKYGNQVLGIAHWDRMGELTLNTQDVINKGDIIQVGKMLHDFGECVILWNMQGEYYMFDTMTLESFNDEEVQVKPFDGSYVDFIKYLNNLI